MIAGLSDTDLADWASEADSRINGLSRHERQGLLNLLAQSLGGTQAGSSQPAFGSPTDLGRSSYGDDPKDQAQIRDGYRHDPSGLWRIWSD